MKQSTVMDKRLGTNLHLRRHFLTCAKQTVMRELNYTCSVPPPTSPTMLDTHTQFLQSFNIVHGWGRGEAMHFEK